ncbi:MAG TPA: sensor histidine kinase [Pseudonocardiaceae bacterium]|nr:sensor histidine kinase [Pseudonocardiaceae bacterium]
MDDSDVGDLPVGRLRRVHLIVLDTAAALVLVAVAWANLAVGAWRLPGGVPTWLGVVVVVLVGVPVLGRRFRPTAAFRASLVISVAAILLGAVWVVTIDIALALYLVVLDETRREAVRDLVMSLGITLLASMVRPGPDVLGALAFCWAVVIAAWVTGLATKERRDYLAASTRRREQQAVAEERLRIARELHDIVAHSMSLITVKAAVANHVAREHPDEAQDALRVIEAAGRDGLAELRRMLGVLRSDGAPDPELAPTPDLESLGELVERAASANVRVSLTVDGVDSLPDGVGLSVYRIVQEAVTNVIKHAAPTSCTVGVRVDEREVNIEISDQGPTRSASASELPWAGIGTGARVGAPTSTGHGLIGMRERVTAYGGAFTAGPRPTGGFTVSAVLPYAPGRARRLDGERS